MISPPRQPTGSGLVAPLLDLERIKARAMTSFIGYLIVGGAYVFLCVIRLVALSSAVPIAVKIIKQHQMEAFIPGRAVPRPAAEPRHMLTFRVMDSEDSTGTVSYLKAIWRGFLETPATVVGKAPISILNKVVRQTGAGDLHNSGAVGDYATVTSAPQSRTS